MTTLEQHCVHRARANTDMLVLSVIWLRIESLHALSTIQAPLLPLKFLEPAIWKINYIIQNPGKGKRWRKQKH